MANYCHVNCPICPQFEYIQDFIAVLITCKSDEVAVKIEMTVVRIFSKVYEALKGRRFSCQ